MASFEMSDDEFVAQSRRRGRKIAALLILLSIACYSMATMLLDARREIAIKFAWSSVGFAVAALSVLLIVMPIHNLIRQKKQNK
jgi:drug/metabolite transporter (DMT)-like permease